MLLQAVDVRLVDEGFDWPAWLGAAAAIATFVLGLVTLAIVIWTAKVARDSLADAKRTRDAQLLTDLSRRWDEPLVVESANLSSSQGTQSVIDLVEKLYGQDPGQLSPDEKEARAADLDLYSKLFIWPNLLESIGALHAQGAISTEPISQIWAAEIVGAWATWKDPIRRLRELEEDWAIYRPFQELAEQMEPLYKHRKARFAPE